MYHMWHIVSRFRERHQCYQEAYLFSKLVFRQYKRWPMPPKPQELKQRAIESSCVNSKTGASEDASKIKRARII